MLPRSRVLRATINQDGARTAYLHVWLSICQHTGEVRVYQHPRDPEPAAVANIHEVDIDWRARGLYA